MKKLLLAVLLLVAPVAQADSLRLDQTTRLLLSDYPDAYLRLDSITTLRVWRAWANNFLIVDEGDARGINNKLTLGLDLTQNLAVVGQHQVIDYGKSKTDMRVGLQWKFTVAPR